MSIVDMKLIELIQKYQPKTCLEMLCHHPEKKNKLIIKDQNDILGVPELVELEEGTMMGYISLDPFCIFCSQRFPIYPKDAMPALMV